MKMNLQIVTDPIRLKLLELINNFDNCSEYPEYNSVRVSTPYPPDINEDEEPEIHESLIAFKKEKELITAIKDMHHSLEVRDISIPIKYWYATLLGNGFSSKALANMFFVGDEVNQSESFYRIFSSLGRKLNLNKLIKHPTSITASEKKIVEIIFNNIKEYNFTVGDDLAGITIHEIYDLNKKINDDLSRLNESENYLPGFEKIENYFILTEPEAENYVLIGDSQY